MNIKDLLKFSFDDFDDFDTEDHEIEFDELAKITAFNDMSDYYFDLAKEYTDAFYKDFSNINVTESIKTIVNLIHAGEIDINGVNTMLDNMILVFQNSEEYEKCGVVLNIKKGINDKV